MQKFLGAAALALAFAAASGAAAQTAPGVTASTPITVITGGAYVEKAKVGGGDCETPGLLQSTKGALNTARYFVECVHRRAALGPYLPELHEPSQDEVLYILKGEGTFVSGGKIAGKVVEGGDTVHLSTGDVMVVPGGTPHWFKDVPVEITYMLVRMKG